MQRRERTDEMTNNNKQIQIWGTLTFHRNNNQLNGIEFLFFLIFYITTRYVGLRADNQRQAMPHLSNTTFNLIDLLTDLRHTGDT